MIKINLSQVMNSIEIMQKLAGQTFNGKTAFKIARILKRLDEEIKIFNETRTNLIDKYGKRDENNQLVVDERGNCVLQDEHVADFNKELTELLNTVIEINAEQIEVEALDNGAFTPSEIIILEPFIKE